MAGFVCDAFARGEFSPEKDGGEFLILKGRQANDLVFI